MFSEDLPLPLSVEIRAARLVATLERQGQKVASLSIMGNEIKITFVGNEEPVVDPFDLVDMRRASPRKPKND